MSYQKCADPVSATSPSVVCTVVAFECRYSRGPGLYAFRKAAAVKHIVYGLEACLQIHFKNLPQIFRLRLRGPTGGWRTVARPKRMERDVSVPKGQRFLATSLSLLLEVSHALGFCHELVSIISVLFCQFRICFAFAMCFVCVPIANAQRRGLRHTKLLCLSQLLPTVCCNLCNRT